MVITNKLWIVCESNATTKCYLAMYNIKCYINKQMTCIERDTRV